MRRLALSFVSDTITAFIHFTIRGAKAQGFDVEGQHYPYMFSLRLVSMYSAPVQVIMGVSSGYMAENWVQCSSLENG